MQMKRIQRRRLQRLVKSSESRLKEKELAAAVPALQCAEKYAERNLELMFIQFDSFLC